MKRLLSGLVFLAFAALSTASAQQEMLRQKPGKPDPNTPQGRLQEYGDKHKAFEKDKVSLWEAEKSVDVTNPYGRIAADCLNREASLDSAGVKRANHCIETRTKALEAQDRKKGSGQQAATDDAAAAGPEGGTGQAGAEESEGAPGGAGIEPEELTEDGE